MLLVHDTVIALRRAVQDNAMPLTVHDDGSIECQCPIDAAGYIQNGNCIRPQWRPCRQRMLQIAPGLKITAFCLLEPFTQLTVETCNSCNR